MSKFHNVYSWAEPEEKLSEIQRKYASYFKKGETVLDVGCGRGVFLSLLKERGVSPVGIDYDEEMVRVSKNKGFKSVFLSDAESFLKSRKDDFDGIFMSHIIEHVQADTAVSMINSCAEALKSGGKLIIVTPNPGVLWSVENFYLDTTHVRPYPGLLLEKLASDAGLKIIESGIDKDSIDLPKGIIKKTVRELRKYLMGRRLYDFAYGGGVSYLIAQRP